MTLQLELFEVPSTRKRTRQKSTVPNKIQSTPTSETESIIENEPLVLITVQESPLLSENQKARKRWEEWEIKLVVATYTALTGCMMASAVTVAKTLNYLGFGRNVTAIRKKLKPALKEGLYRSVLLKDLEPRLGKEIIDMIRERVNFLHKEQMSPKLTTPNIQKPRKTPIPPPNILARPWAILIYETFCEYFDTLVCGQTLRKKAKTRALKQAMKMCLDKMNFGISVSTLAKWVRSFIEGDRMTWMKTVDRKELESMKLEKPYLDIIERSLQCELDEVTIDKAMIEFVTVRFLIDFSELDKFK
ncbi:hypothetical protein PCE1_001775 [Barthelona sp. PCE]